MRNSLRPAVAAYLSRSFAVPSKWREQQEKPGIKMASGRDWRWKELLEDGDILGAPLLSSTAADRLSDRLSQRLNLKVTSRSSRRSGRSERPETLADVASRAIATPSPPLPLPATLKRVPVVLVHGFGGWGREEMGGQFFYWGGFQDIAKKMMDSNPGLVVLTAAVGPFSSVWDRAIELFYQLKGGTVDYGAKHSKHFGHDRWGSTFPGLYPEWDADHPVDFVGHSMGGLTARALVQMLEDNGRSKGEESLFPKGSTLSGRWVRSVTTISTPHDGSPAADMAAAMHNIIFSTMSMSLGFMGAVSHQVQVVYDFKLHQWGIAPRGRDETWAEYYTRVTTARVFTEGTKDLSEHDLTLDGAAELNSWVQDHPQVYYLSYESCSTYQSPLSLFSAQDDATHIPIFSTRAIFLPSCYLLGQGMTLPPWTRDHHVTGASWRPNDGMVPCRSQRGPTFRLTPGGKRVVLADSEVVDHAGEVCAGRAGHRGNKCRVHATMLRTGVWNFLGRLDELDHLACIGWTDKTVWDFNCFMHGHFKILAALPSVASET